MGRIIIGEHQFYHGVHPDQVKLLAPSWYQPRSGQTESVMVSLIYRFDHGSTRDHDITGCVGQFSTALTLPVPQTVASCYSLMLCWVGGGEITYCKTKTVWQCVSSLFFFFFSVWTHKIRFLFWEDGSRRGVAEWGEGRGNTLCMA